MDKEKRMVKIFKGDGFPIVSIKPDRNAKCQCGSGKKAKNCCGVDPKYYSTHPKNLPQPEKTHN